MRSAEVVVDFYACQGESLHVRRDNGIPCSVKVMDCSNFSNSSVRLSALGCPTVLWRDMSGSIDTSDGGMVRYCVAVLRNAIPRRVCLGKIRLDWIRLDRVADWWGSGCGPSRWRTGRIRFRGSLIRL